MPYPCLFYTHNAESRDPRDLLLRHQATHTKEAAKAKTGSDRTAERAIRACDACALAKLKCDNARPCKRCKERGVSCHTHSLSQRQTRAEAAERTLHGDGLRRGISESGAGQPQSISRTVETHILPTDDLMPVPEANLFSDAEAWPTAAFDANAFDFPSFFEHIMDPDSNLDIHESVQFPPELSSLMPNRDWYSESDVFGIEFTPILDEAMGAIAYDFTSSSIAEPTDASGDNGDANQTASQRHLIYQQSPW